MKLTCRYYKLSLALYIYGELEHVAPDRFAKLERHLATCAACRAEIRSLTATDRLVLLHARASARPVQPRSSVSNRVMQAIQPEDRYLSPVRWTPSTMSFVSVALFAGLFITIINPETGAKAWFQTTLLGQKPTPVAVKHPAPPFPANNDPFASYTFSAPKDARLGGNSEPVAVTPPSVARDGTTPSLDGQDPSANAATMMSPTPQSSARVTQRESQSSYAAPTPPAIYADKAQASSSTVSVGTASMPSADGAAKPAISAGVSPDSGNALGSVMPIDASADMPPSPPPTLPVSNAAETSVAGDAGSMLDVNAKRGKNCAKPKSDTSAPVATTASGTDAAPTAR